MTTCVLNHCKHPIHAWLRDFSDAVTVEKSSGDHIAAGGIIFEFIINHPEYIQAISQELLRHRGPRTSADVEAFIDGHPLQVEAAGLVSHEM